MRKDTERYHVEDALREAVDLLHRHFQDVDQGAAVELATLLYTTRERDQFLREHPEEPGTAYP